MILALNLLQLLSGSKLNQQKKYFYFLLALCCCAQFFIAQTKSNQIETIEGKKFYIHTIEKSQSLYAISKMYHLTIEEIYSQNPILKKGVKAFLKIKIPVVEQSQIAISANTVAINIDTTKYLAHKILKGETVFSICKKYNLSEKQFADLNTSSTAYIKEGQIIVVGEKQKKKVNNTVASAAAAKDNKPMYTVKEAKQAPLVLDSTLLKPFSKPKKLNYNLGLILPFRFDEILNLDISEAEKNKASFPAVPNLAYDFYLGFKKACDTLTDNDFKTSIQVYDIDNKDSLRIFDVVNDTKFKTFDMVFGPLFAGGFKTVSKAAKENHIPIVSPFTQQNKILYNNMYVSKTNPSQYTLLESLADYCIDSLKKNGTKVFILLPSDKEKKEIQFAQTFKKYYNDKIKTLKKSIKDSIISIKGISSLKEILSTSDKNVVVMLSTNEVFIADFTTQLAMLASDKKIFTLCGWENLRTMENIDQTYLNQLNYTFPVQYNLTNLNKYENLRQEFKNNQNTYPSEYFFIGYEVALFYLKYLKEQGPDFVFHLNEFNGELNYLKFNFFRPDGITGFDNRGTYIFKYTNFELVKCSK